MSAKHLRIYLVQMMKQSLFFEIDSESLWPPLNATETLLQIICVGIQMCSFSIV